VHLLSGTSMAAAHVSGLVAYSLSLYGQMEPRDMLNLLEHWATKDVINMTDTAKDAGTPNRLARNDVPDGDDYDDNNIGHAVDNL